MTPDRLSQARQAVQNARQALRQGDRQSARRWAEHAASLAPDLEDPWLILGAVAAPRASLAYMQQALKVNPDSQRARQGLDWAQRRLDQTVTGQTAPTPVPRTQIIQPDPEPVPPSSAPQPVRRKSPLLLTWILVPVCLVLGIVAWSASTTPAMAAILHGTPSPSKLYAQADVVKPTYTPSPTITPSPTFTPTPLPTYTATPEPTSTHIPGVETRPDDPPPSYSGDKSILVDISEQHLYAYEGDVLVYSFVASTGMNNATRVGTFQVLDKIPNAYGATWNIWMPNWMGIYWSGTLENGIHALPILSSGARLWSGYLGTPISYGCVVLGVEESQLLYDWADIGTPVTIQW
jgi:lipoprotein-anchoring transpeptidase ErfK/SrfK